MQKRLGRSRERKKPGEKGPRETKAGNGPALNLALKMVFPCFSMYMVASQHFLSPLGIKRFLELIAEKSTSVTSSIWIYIHELKFFLRGINPIKNWYTFTGM